MRRLSGILMVLVVSFGWCWGALGEALENPLPNQVAEYLFFLEQCEKSGIPISADPPTVEVDNNSARFTYTPLIGVKYGLYYRVDKGTAEINLEELEERLKREDNAFRSRSLVIGRDESYAESNKDTLLLAFLESHDMRRKASFAAKIMEDLSAGLMEKKTPGTLESEYAGGGSVYTFEVSDSTISMYIRPPLIF